MTSSSANSVKSTVIRTQPLLGTFIEIRASGASRERVDRAITRAFAAVSRVQRVMSPHQHDSDIARLNRAPLGTRVRVHPWTARVLRAAQSLSRASDGVFDVTVNTWLRRPAADLRQDAAATPVTDWRAIVVGPGATIRRLSDVRVDLGGIAKGFAVDRAIDALRRAGVTHAVVNAGGDLRVLGRTSERVLVRHPANPAVIIPLLDLTDGAVCTSANYLDAPGHERLRRPDGRALAADHHSISVCAPSCMIADALTKIVAAIGVRESRALLERHRASALVLSRNGRMIASDPASHAA